MNKLVLNPIAYIHSDYSSNFGIPRQSGMLEDEATIVFEKEYRAREAVRGIDDFSHLWLIWGFTLSSGHWSPTVRPPKLGGNRRKGVFATRSPFRPNPLGLSCVKLLKVTEKEGQGIVLTVLGADLLDGTPIYDIKPYIPFADCRPEASGGFTEKLKDNRIEVEFPKTLLDKLPENKRNSAIEMLRIDPRPGYQDDSQRKYGLTYAGYEIRFTVCDNVLTVVDCLKANQ